MERSLLKGMIRRVDFGREENLRKIARNAIRCNKCGDEIESVYTHDFKCCSCGAVAVDGGKEYLRRCGERNDFTELSTYEEWKKKC